MNNQMDDFSTPGTENAYGLRASPANFIAAKKRPLSSSVPVAMFDDEQPTFVAGASGGSRIITGTFYVRWGYFVCFFVLFCVFLFIFVHFCRILCTFYHYFCVF